MVIEPLLAQQMSKGVRLALQPASRIETRRATKVCDTGRGIVYYGTNIIFIRSGSRGSSNSDSTTKVEEASKKCRSRDGPQRGQ